MKKYWQSSIELDNGAKTDLFICTTDDVVRHDQGRGERGQFSLVMEARRRYPLTAERESSYQFAKSAFQAHCGSRKKWNGAVNLVREVPEFLEALPVGRVSEFACSVCA